jgi:phosphoglycerate dehydrogenase-like enzyme
MPEPINVLITLPFTPEQIDQLRAVSPRFDFTCQHIKKPEEISPELWQQVEILYTSSVLPKPEQVPNLRWIQFHYAGLDRFLEHPLLHSPDLIATNLSGANAPQVAEYILSMLLAFGHRLPELRQQQQIGEWPRDRWERFSPIELRGSTVGIVGYGSIGRQVARLLQPFGAVVLAVKADARKVEDEGYSPEGMGDAQGNLVRRIYPPQAIRSMVGECDFVVVTVPLTPDTQNLVDGSVFQEMKPTSFLIDISRGGVVDHDALYEALCQKKIAGAALDVFPQEPLPKESPLWGMPNVILTPHIAGNTPHYTQRGVDLFAVNLDRYLLGLRLFNQVDLTRGY